MRNPKKTKYTDYSHFVTIVSTSTEKRVRVESCVIFILSCIFYNMICIFKKIYINIYHKLTPLVTICGEKLNFTNVEKMLNNMRAHFPLPSIQCTVRLTAHLLKKHRTQWGFRILYLHALNASRLFFKCAAYRCN